MHLPVRNSRGTILIVLLLVTGACSSGGTATTQGQVPSSTTAAEAPNETTSTLTPSTQPPGLVLGADGKLPTLADGFPDSPITLWAAFAAGHGDDVLNRSVSLVATKYSPVRIAVDNYEAGAGMAYALVDQYLKDLPRAEEGYHIYTANFLGMAVRPYSTEPVASYDIDFLKAINALMYRGFVFAVPLDSEFTTLEDVATAAQQNPNGLRFCAGTATSTVTLAGYAWLDETGVEMTFVPADGSGEAQQLMLGGGCEMATWTYIPGMEDQFKLLAVTDSERNEVLPDVPTMTELGYTPLGGSLSGYGVLPEVPQEHVDWLNALFALVVDDPEFRSANEGAQIRMYSPEEVQELMLADLDAFYPVMERLGMTVRDR